MKTLKSLDFVPKFTKVSIAVLFSLIIRRGGSTIRFLVLLSFCFFFFTLIRFLNTTTVGLLVNYKLGFLGAGLPKLRRIL